MKLLNRVSPILGRQTKTSDLSFYAPSPWKIVKCMESNLVYLQNPPEYEHLEEDLAWEKTRTIEKKKRVEEEPIRSAVSNRLKKLKGLTKRNKIRDMIKSYIAKNSLKDDIMMVDVGCAEGQTLINTIAELPENVQDRCIPNGIEISKSLADFAKKNAPKGHWVCNNAVDGMLEKWCGFRHPDHVNYFTPETLVKTCKKAGYSKIKMGLFDKQVFSDSMYATLTK